MTIIYWALNMLKAKYRQFTYVGAFISHKNANRWILFLSSVDGKEMRIEILSKLPEKITQSDEVRDKVSLQTQVHLV